MKFLNYRLSRNAGIEVGKNYSKEEFFYRTQEFSNFHKQQVKDGKLFAKNRSELVNRAQTEVDFILKYISKIDTPSMISLGSGVCWHEILLSKQLKDISVIATTHISQDVKIIRDHLINNFDIKNLFFEELDALNPKKNFPNLTDEYTLLMCGATALFENEEIIEFIKFMAPKNIILLCKDGEYIRFVSVIKSFLYWLISILTRQELIKLGYFRSTSEIRKIFHVKCGYKVKGYYRMPMRAVGGPQQLFHFVSNC